MKLFNWVGFILIVLGLVVGVPVIGDYAHTGLVPRLPSALLAVALVGAGMLSIVCGLILDTTVKGRRKDYEMQVIEAYGRYRRQHEGQPDE